MASPQGMGMGMEMGNRTYKANGTLVSQFGKSLQHLSGDSLSGRCEGAVDVKETDGLLDGPVLEIRVRLSHFGRWKFQSK